MPSIAFNCRITEKANNNGKAKLKLERIITIDWKIGDLQRSKEKQIWLVGHFSTERQNGRPRVARKYRFHKFISVLLFVVRIKRAPFLILLYRCKVFIFIYCKIVTGYIVCAVILFIPGKFGLVK